VTASVTRHRRPDEREKGFETVQATDDDLRGPARTERQRDVASAQAKAHGASAEGSVTKRVTVPISLLRQLVDLGRRADADAPALAEVERLLASL
jgi:hypothetical protein